MAGRAMKRAATLIGWALGVGAVAFAANEMVRPLMAQETPTCSLSQIEIKPALVIAPCTTIIDNAEMSAPDRGNALLIRGKGYHHTKRFDLAKRDYDAALELIPDNTELLDSRANISFRTGNGTEGLALTEMALAKNPADAHALRTVGTLYENTDPVKAVRFYTMALASDPKDPYTLMFRSKSHARLRQFTEALADADALVSMKPQEINRPGYLDSIGNLLDFHVMALKNRAQVYGAMGKISRAEEDFDTAVKYSPSAEAFYNRGMFFIGIPSRERDAAADLDKAASLDPRNPWNHYAKGTAHVALKDFQGALGAFNEALMIEPHFGYVLRERAFVFRALGQTDRAVHDIKHAMAVSAQARSQIMPSLRRAGYWKAEDPTVLTPALSDAIQACMLDKSCN